MTGEAGGRDQCFPGHASFRPIGRQHQFVPQGLISDAEFPDCTAALARHLDDPAALVPSHALVQAWGRKT